MTTLAASKPVSREIAFRYCGSQTHPLGQQAEFHPQELSAKEIIVLLYQSALQHSGVEWGDNARIQCSYSQSTPSLHEIRHIIGIFIP